jgi:nicotinic acid phosphoribosyltransferase
MGVDDSLWCHYNLNAGREEQRMAASLLMTDGYKFSMAEAGWPLRKETFYWSHRRGGPQLLPFDAEAEVRALLPYPEPEDLAWLEEHGYGCGPAFKAAMERHAAVTVNALPKGSVFFPREPIISVTGPSALVSWLESLLLTWNFRVQVATVATFAPEQLAAAVGVVTCERQRELTLEALDAVGVRPPEIIVEPDAYRERVHLRARELVSVVHDPSRIFEVGFRSCSCPEQHLIALEGCKQAGVMRTSHVWGARERGMVAMGTMGHEHVQRYGSDDAAFRAMTERRPSRVSYLLDTYDTLRSGIPAAYALIAERPGEHDSIRYDSGDKEAQYRAAAALAKERGIRPVQILEDGFDLEQTRRFEELRREVGWEQQEQVYGYGGYLVAGTSGSPLTRDRVQAVYKLSQTGHRPTMKFGNESGAGKQSIPGRPVLFRRSSGGTGPIGVVGQEGEVAPKGYSLLSGSARAFGVAQARSVAEADHRLSYSPATQALVEACRREAFGS